jgi:hypothetical protein
MLQNARSIQIMLCDHEFARLNSTCRGRKNDGIASAICTSSDR